jgi:hypothetical protein
VKIGFLEFYLNGEKPRKISRRFVWRRTAEEDTEDPKEKETQSALARDVFSVFSFPSFPGWFSSRLIKLCGSA